ncbi:MAG: hypothetical protein KatS3mg027_2019 [Bacteroidia bacterium]|nr:MAG: hypothetical protein KatS3mg027_2019 [Bacteroidia bacterium]
MHIYSEHSFLWLLLIVPLALIIAYFQYYYKNKNSTVFSKNTKKVLFFLRFILLLILALLLLDFYSKFTKNEYIKPNIIIAIDNSQSMISAKDSAAVKSFINSQFKTFINELSDKLDVQILTFGEKNQFITDSILFNEHKSNAENIFTTASDVLNNSSINAMIMMTDGIFNEGIHPVSLTDNINYPVYVIGTGDTTLYKDIAVKNVLHNKNVYIGNDFMVEALIQANSVKNEKVKISIFENNQELVSKDVLINSDIQPYYSVQFQLSANKGGHHTYKIKTTLLKDEHNTKNNEFYFNIHVIENKTKVLILYTAPHPDISAIRQSLNSSLQYEVDCFQENTFNNNLKNYDVVVYHSPNNNSVLFNKCLQLNIPMFIINAQLNTIQNKFLSIKQFIPNQTNEIEAQFNSSFSAFALNNDYNSISPYLPIILAPYGDYSPLGEYEILCYQKINNVFTELPLFYFTQTTSGKFAVFLGDGLWRWKMTNFQIYQNTDWFNHLILNTFRYLSVKKDKRPFKVFIPPVIYENDPLRITAELLNETMQPITDPDVFFTIKDSSKNEFKFVFNKAANNYFLNAGILPSGEYTYKALTQYKGKEYEQSGKLHILPYSIEKNNLTAQHSPLKTLAQKTNGKFYLLHQIEELKKDILNNDDIKTIITQNETYQYWIENKYWLILIVLLSLSEWIIRRWNGVI